jgi:hypothetical protein
MKEASNARATTAKHAQYLIQTRFITDTVLLLLACLAGIGFLWFNPIFFYPLILSIAGLALIFSGCIFRYLVLLHSNY